MPPTSPCWKHIAISRELWLVGICLPPPSFSSILRTSFVKGTPSALKVRADRAEEEDLR